MAPYGANFCFACNPREKTHIFCYAGLRAPPSFEVVKYRRPKLKPGTPQMALSPLMGRSQPDFQGLASASVAWTRVRRRKMTKAFGAIALPGYRQLERPFGGWWERTALAAATGSSSESCSGSLMQITKRNSTTEEHRGQSTGTLERSRHNSPIASEKAA